MGKESRALEREINECAHDRGSEDGTGPPIVSRGRHEIVGDRWKICLRLDAKKTMGKD
jgi:hypothetical protein